MDEFAAALERTLHLLRNSKHDGGLVCIEESIPLLEKQLDYYKRNGKLSCLGRGRLRFLFLPTNELQEISVLNGWGDEYLELAEIVDRHINRFFSL